MVTCIEGLQSKVWQPEFSQWATHNYICRPLAGFLHGNIVWLYLKRFYDINISLTLLIICFPGKQLYL